MGQEWVKNAFSKLFKTTWDAQTSVGGPWVGGGGGGGKGGKGFQVHFPFSSGEGVSVTRGPNGP